MSASMSWVIAFLGSSKRENRKGIVAGEKSPARGNVVNEALADGPCGREMWRKNAIELGFVHADFLIARISQHGRVGRPGGIGEVKISIPLEGRALEVNVV